MEQKLQSKARLSPISVKKEKRSTSLLSVDIYCIGAVCFYWTLIKPDIIPFVTSLYKIDQIIEEKEVEAIYKDTA
jgi:hypothetical protein